MSWERLGVIAIAALAAVLVTTGDARTAPVVVNGGFEAFTGTAPSTSSGGEKTFFSNANVTGWSGGTGSGTYAYLVAPGTADIGSHISVYGPFPATSPNGGNFYMADGDPAFRSSAITQSISGLTVGQKYAISFYQAAGQQQGFTGATFEQWQVGFGSDTQFSSLMNTPSQGLVPWQSQSLIFTATSTSETLSFLAIGGPNTNNLPPMVFLDGVSIAAVPEPSSIALMCIMLLSLGIAYRRHRAALPAAI
jgi:hypothetical protein